MKASIIIIFVVSITLLGIGIYGITNFHTYGWPKKCLCKAASQELVQALTVTQDEESAFNGTKIISRLVALYNKDSKAFPNITKYELLKLYYATVNVKSKYDTIYRRLAAITDLTDTLYYTLFNETIVPNKTYNKFEDLSQWNIFKNLCADLTSIQILNTTFQTYEKLSNVERKLNDVHKSSNNNFKDAKTILEPIQKRASEYDPKKIESIEKEIKETLQLLKIHKSEAYNHHEFIKTSLDTNIEETKSVKKLTDDINSKFAKINTKLVSDLNSGSARISKSLTKRMADMETSINGALSKYRPDNELTRIQHSVDTMLNKLDYIKNELSNSVNNHNTSISNLLVKTSTILNANVESTRSQLESLIRKEIEASKLNRIITSNTDGTNKLITKLSSLDSSISKLASCSNKISKIESTLSNLPGKSDMDRATKMIMNIPTLDSIELSLKSIINKIPYTTLDNIQPILTKQPTLIIDALKPLISNIQCPGSTFNPEIFKNTTSLLLDLDLDGQFFNKTLNTVDRTTLKTQKLTTQTFNDLHNLFNSLNDKLDGMCCHRCR